MLNDSSSNYRKKIEEKKGGAWKEEIKKVEKERRVFKSER